jgi:hypothetical protein
LIYVIPGHGGQDSIEYPVQVREPTRITARHDLPPADDIYRANSSRHDPLVIDYNAQNQSNRKDPVIIDYNSQNQSNRPYEGYGGYFLKYSAFKDLKSYSDYLNTRLVNQIDPVKALKVMF